jgi:PDZ domain
LITDCLSRRRAHEGGSTLNFCGFILPANSTIGYDDLAYLTVKKVNGKEIKSLDDLAEVVKQPVEGFIKIETEEDPKQIELDASQVAAEAPTFQENYGISSLQRLQ